MNAIDTNIWVYAFDDSEPDKQLVATALIDKLILNPSETILPWQVVGELMACLRRWQLAGRITSSLAETLIQSTISTFSIVAPNRNVVSRSIDLYNRHNLSHWDSLLLAACIEAGVTTLYSEDLTHDAIYDSVKVVNPFV